MNERWCVVSTLGTSLLTNEADNELRRVLQATANLGRKGYDADALAKVEGRVQQVKQDLLQAAPEIARRMSAELNGILALPNGGRGARHYLLHSDTYQGEACAELVKTWLEANGYRDIRLQRIDCLSTAGQEEFALGIDALLKWCDNELRPLREKHYRVVFNLTGGFKSFQAYAHTIGMLYADEICYIFEGPGSPLLLIPRLPIQVLTDSLQEHAALAVRLAAGENVSEREVRGIPEAFLTIMDGYATFSEWGKLAWNQIKRDVLSKDLLHHPGLDWDQRFRRDYEDQSDPEIRITLQEALAKVAILWRRNGLSALAGDPDLRYEAYPSSASIGHFDVGHGWRVSCKAEKRLLQMRRFGLCATVDQDP